MACSCDSHSLSRGSALKATISCEGPVFASAGPEGTLLRVLTDFHLESLLVTFFILVGREVHACQTQKHSIL